jgi:hypothetical protein
VGAHLDLQLAHAGCERQRHPEHAGIQPARQGFGEGDDDAALAHGRDRVDTQLVLVAGRGFQQPRVHAPAAYVLEDFLALGLGHRHRVAQPAIDVQREAGHHLALLQRELQLAFEHAMVGIEEAQLHAGARLVAEEVDLDGSRAQLDGLARVGVDGNHRRPPVGRRHEFEGLGRLRDRAERQRRQAEADGHGGLEKTDGDACGVAVWHGNPLLLAMHPETGLAQQRG